MVAHLALRLHTIGANARKLDSDSDREGRATAVTSVLHVGEYGECAPEPVKYELSSRGSGRGRADAQHLPFTGWPRQALDSATGGFKGAPNPSLGTVGNQHPTWCEALRQPLEEAIAPERWGCCRTERVVEHDIIALVVPCCGVGVSE